ncbi:hypothetical protein SKAU_G00300010 [Synaphobranchus kaupii]|uniref:Uncharacterized protein n=1 Tax=Synaphobranchus kaupii TaxID=118154 RepID=A0A9Q1IN60_SYNKA|nr:hypothetical protein SKAU_G00300010 [Synaphobranchus kaupii]
MRQPTCPFVCRRMAKVESTHRSSSQPLTSTDQHKRGTEHSSVSEHSSVAVMMSEYISVTFSLLKKLGLKSFSIPLTDIRTAAADPGQERHWLFAFIITGILSSSSSSP